MGEKMNNIDFRIYIDDNGHGDELEYYDIVVGLYPHWGLYY